MKTRNQYYTLLAVGKNQLKWDDDFYRDWLFSHDAKEKDGKFSASTMTLKQLDNAYNAMRRSGFVVKQSKVKNINESRLRKIAAIWIALHDAGVIINRSKQAMITWCQRTVRISKIEWFKSHHYNQCIEALKQLAKKNGVKLNG